MKVLICYFSGTGNTKKIIDLYTDCFNKQEISLELYNIEKNNFNIDPNEYDLIGLAYPIHAFNAPSIVLGFVKSFPKLKAKKRLFIIKTSGEALAINNISSLKLKKIFKKKNLILNNEYHYLMPYNIIFRHSDVMVHNMWFIATNLVQIDCQEIMAGVENKLPYFFMGCFLSWLFRIEHWGGRFNGKRYLISDSCIKCNKCVTDCPTHNIEIVDGRFVFKNKCLMCMRCAFYCPTDSVRIGLFNRWKVNGAYNFNRPEEIKEDRHKRYCKRSYRKYFIRSLKKLDYNKYRQ